MSSLLYVEAIFSFILSFSHLGSGSASIHADPDSGSLRLCGSGSETLKLGGENGFLWNGGNAEGISTKGFLYKKLV